MSRVKQFIKDITSSRRLRDDEFIDTYLNEKEREEFLKLRHAEVLHSVDVAKLTLNDLEKNDSLNKDMDENERKLFIKASMLHDLGKNKYPLSVMGKTFAVVLGKFQDKKEFYKGNNKILDIYINHPFYGYEILKNLKSFEGYDYLYDLVRYHSDVDKYNDNKNKKEMDLFLIYKKADDRC